MDQATLHFDSVHSSFPLEGLGNRLRHFLYKCTFKDEEMQIMPKNGLGLHGRKSFYMHIFTMTDDDSLMITLAKLCNIQQST